MLSHENTSSFADGFPTAGTMAWHFVRTAKTKGDGFLLTLRLFSRYDVPGIRLTFDAGPDLFPVRGDIVPARSRSSITLVVQQFYVRK